MIQISAMINPFQFGRELGANELVDREDEIAQVVGTIREGGKLFIVGPRRYGKTSILKAAEDQLAGEEAIVLRYDAESYPSVDLGRGTGVGSRPEPQGQCALFGAHVDFDVELSRQPGMNDPVQNRCVARYSQAKPTGQ
jgi:hypothetical protein